MNKFFAEYGKFMVAVLGSAFLFGMFSWMVHEYKTYSTNLIKVITGVESTEYVETTPGEAGD